MSAGIYTSFPVPGVDTHPYYDPATREVIYEVLPQLDPVVEPLPEAKGRWLYFNATNMTYHEFDSQPKHPTPLKNGLVISGHEFMYFDHDAFEHLGKGLMNRLRGVGFLYALYKDMTFSLFKQIYRLPHVTVDSVPHPRSEWYDYEVAMLRRLGRIFDRHKQGLVSLHPRTVLLIGAASVPKEWFTLDGVVTVNFTTDPFSHYDYAVAVGPQCRALAQRTQCPCVNSLEEIEQCLRQMVLVR